MTKKRDLGLPGTDAKVCRSMKMVSRVLFKYLAYSNTVFVWLALRVVRLSKKTAQKTFPARQNVPYKP